MGGLFSRPPTSREITDQIIEGRIKLRDLSPEDLDAVVESINITDLIFLCQNLNIRNSCEQLDLWKRKYIDVYGSEVDPGLSYEDNLINMGLLAFGFPWHTRRLMKTKQDISTPTEISVPHKPVDIQTGAYWRNALVPVTGVLDENGDVRLAPKYSVVPMRAKITQFRISKVPKFRRGVIMSIEEPTTFSVIGIDTEGNLREWVKGDRTSRIIFDRKVTQLTTDKSGMDMHRNPGIAFVDTEGKLWSNSFIPTIAPPQRLEFKQVDTGNIEIEQIQITPNVLVVLDKQGNLWGLGGLEDVPEGVDQEGMLVRISTNERIKKFDVSQPILSVVTEDGYVKNYMGERERDIPKEIRIEGEKIVDVSTGHHVVALTENGRIITTGDDSRQRGLGSEIKETELPPFSILPNNVRAVKVKAGATGYTVGIGFIE